MSSQRKGGMMPPPRKFFIGMLLFFTVATGEQGQTRIQSYTVNTNIEKRFAQTTIAVDFINEKDCATVHGFTMHLPMNARVTELSVSASNDCEMNGEVKPLFQAQQEFEQLASEGKPAAIVKSWDEVQYPVRVSLPPMGNTLVEIHLEELLYRRNDKIAFQIPLSPGLPVDTLVMDVSISEPDSGVSNFDMDSVSRGAIQISRTMTKATAHLELTNVSGNELDRLAHGTYDYDPADVPSNGLLFGSRTCVSHLFNPAQSLLEQGYMPRNIVFVIDVSGSMSGQKLQDAKAAFNTIIQTLTSNDFLTIHTFSTSGTESVWGPSQATSYERNDASSFVNRLEAGGSTNLYQAFGDGLTKVRSMQAMNEGSTQQVPIVIILTDGQATAGPTSSRDIARAVRNLNEDIEAKIFALAFGEAADLPLLLGICIQNGGKAVQIYEGYGDSAEQMIEFYEGELGNILLSDVNVDFANANADLGYQTQTQFPVFPSGSEVFVRARTLGEGTFEGLFKAVTTATSVNGSNQWTAEIDMNDASIMPYNRECLQSFAHEKVTEILRFRDAARSLGNELEDFAPYPTDIAFSRSTGGNIVGTAEARALELALEAQLVWPGLTAMVTVENEACAAMFAEGNEVCSDGDKLDEDEEGFSEEEDDWDAMATADTAATVAPQDSASYDSAPPAEYAPTTGESPKDNGSSGAPEPLSGGSGGGVALSPGSGDHESWPSSSTTKAQLNRLVTASSLVLTVLVSGIVSA